MITLAFLRIQTYHVSTIMKIYLINFVKVCFEVNSVCVMIHRERRPKASTLRQGTVALRTGGLYFCTYLQ